MSWMWNLCLIFEHREHLKPAQNAAANRERANKDIVVRQDDDQLNGGNIAANSLVMRLRRLAL